MSGVRTKFPAGAAVIASLAFSAPAFALDPYAALPVFLAGSAPASAFGNHLIVNVEPSKDDSYFGDVVWGKDGNKSETFELKALKVGGYEGTIYGPEAEQKQTVKITMSNDGSIFVMTAPDAGNRSPKLGDDSPGAMLTAVPNDHCGYDVTIKWMSGPTQHFTITEDNMDGFRSPLDTHAPLGKSVHIWDYRSDGGGHSVMFDNVV